MSNIVQPTKNASTIYEITSAIISDIIPFGSTLKAGFDFLVKKRLEEGQILLINEIKSKGIDIISEERWDYFIPSAYRFFEQVRLGEYNYNLIILGRLIANDLKSTDIHQDVGKIARAARKLEMLPYKYLRALSRCERAFEIYTTKSECDHYWICIDNAELIESFSEIGENVLPIHCDEWLHELSARGILTTGGRPSRVGGHYYYRNQFYHEIIKEATSTPPE